MTAPPVPAASSAPFARVLLATDFSPCSEHALRYAVAVAQAYGSHLYVLHARHPDEPVRESGYGPVVADAGRWRAEKQLRGLANSSPLSAVPHSTLLKTGCLWEVADRIIRSQEIGLAVVGYGGRHGLEKLLIGSHAEDICRHAACPVLVVGPRAQAPPPEFRLRRILFATAYHAGSRRALGYAHSVAARCQAELILFHALDVGDFGAAGADQLLAQTQEQLGRLVPRPAGVRISALAQACTSPAAAILSMAREQAADLIVVGVHAHPVALVTHLPWNTAHRVICEAGCPVLTVAG